MRRFILLIRKERLESPTISRSNYIGSTFFSVKTLSVGPVGVSLPRSRFLDVTQCSPKETFLWRERCVTSKKLLRGRLGRSRTHDLPHASPTLNQLSYLGRRFNCHPQSVFLFHVLISILAGSTSKLNVLLS